MQRMLEMKLSDCQVRTFKFFELWNHLCFWNPAKGSYEEQSRNRFVGWTIFSATHKQLISTGKNCLEGSPYLSLSLSLISLYQTRSKLGEFPTPTTLRDRNGNTLSIHHYPQFKEKLLLKSQWLCWCFSTSCWKINAFHGLPTLYILSQRGSAVAKFLSVQGANQTSRRTSGCEFANLETSRWSNGGKMSRFRRWKTGHDYYKYLLCRPNW